MPRRDPKKFTPEENLTHWFFKHQRVIMKPMFIEAMASCAIEGNPLYRCVQIAAAVAIGRDIPEKLAAGAWERVKDWNPSDGFPENHETTG